MRKVYVLYGWTPKTHSYLIGIYSSKKKAEHQKNILHLANDDKTKIYRIETEVIL